METINILPIIDRLDHLLLGNMLWQRQLNDKTIHVRIVVQLIDLTEQLLLSDIRLVTDQRRLETNLLTSPDLVCHVGFATAIMSYQDRRQMWHLATLGLDAGNLFGHLPFHLGGNGLSVQ